MRELSGGWVTPAKRAALALVVAGVAAAGPAVNVAEAQQPLPPCSQYLVIGVPSSPPPPPGPDSQFGMGRQVGNYVRGASMLLPAPPTTQYYTLDYQVVSGEDNPGEYLDSVSRGQQALQNLVRERIRTCPGIRMGLAGYSQGAQVVAQAINSFIPEEQVSIGAVLMLGNPVSAGDTSYDIAVTSDGRPGSHNGRGALGVLMAPAGLQDRTIDFCITGDPICDGVGVASLAQAAFNDFPHRSYAECCGVGDRATSFPDIVGGIFADFLTGRRRR